MLTIEGVTYRIGGRAILENASAQISTAQKVGLVGRNGAGKSTLLGLIAGRLQPDAGAIGMPRALRIGAIAQEAPGGETTPLQSVLAADVRRAELIAEAERAIEPDAIAELQARLDALGAHAAPARAAAILAGLGFDEAMQQQPLAAFSGGWRMRAALAAALFVEADLLLLDEPTNHLDLETALWLEGFLKRSRTTMIVVSHDRNLLNAIATHILHLDRGELTLYPGDYDTFARRRRERMTRQAALAVRQEQERKRLQAFIDRFRAKASKARQAQSRVKALARMEAVALIPEDPAVVFALPEPKLPNPPLITFDGVAVGYEPGRPVLRNIDLRLDPEDRIALLGANGNGKTTLARLIAGRLAPMAGFARRAPKLHCGYFAQHQIEELRAAETPVQHLARLMPKAREEELRARLGRFGFSGDKALVPVGSLSGGEKARLTLALATAEAPPLLVLDEPTNHLDIEAREALVAALNDFPGAVVLVSHDWHLVELVADRLWLVAQGTAAPFDGDLDDYRAFLAAAQSESRAVRAGGGAERNRRRVAAERRRELEPLRRIAREAETVMNRLATEKQELERLLSDPATYRKPDPERAALLRRQVELARALIEAEHAWLAAEEAIEAERRRA